MASSARGSGTKVSTCSTKAPTSTRSAPRCDFHDIDRACGAVHRAEDVARRLGRAEQGRAAYLFRARAVRGGAAGVALARRRSEEHTSELQSLMRISYAVFCLKKKKINTNETYD